jgi:NAD+ diphosphatase
MNFLFTVKQPSDLTQSVCFIFKEASLLIDISGASSVLPSFDTVGSNGIPASKPLFFGHKGTCGFYCSILQSEENAPYILKSLRELFTILDEFHFSLAMRAYQVLNWELTNRYCGRCGSPLNTSSSEVAKVCPECQLTVFPRINPAVIVAIIKDNSILLARNSNFPLHSVIAGYVETGESLEETVMRETFEEVGIKVKNVRYFSSQPWAFSYSLMIGFTAEYDSGEITPDGIEIKEAAWYTKDNLPSTLPGPISIARKLIDWFVNQ